MLQEALLQEWHPTKNEGVDPNKVTPGSGKKVWWICEKGHEWDAKIANRSKGAGCHYCTGRKASYENCLATVKPEVAKQWHPNKNGDLTPNDVTYGSKKRVWWKCEKGHEWDARINDRSSGKGCPYCSHNRVSDLNRLSVLYPDLAKEWHPTKNKDITPNDISYATNKRYWWICKKGHDWKTSPNARTSNDTGCPYCSHNKVSEENSLAKLFPQLVEEWNYERNKDLSPSSFAAFSTERVWWKCKLGHEWDAIISSRTNSGSGCPKCFNKTSFAEQTIHFYLNKIFSKVESRKQFKIKKKKVEVDIYIPDLNLAIEYDGEFYHRKKLKKDKEKIDLLRGNHIEIINLREEGLEKVNELELTVEPGEKGLKAAIQSLVALVNKIFGLNQNVDIDIERDQNDILNNYIYAEKQNSLAVLCPEVASEWNYEKNGNLRPENFSKSSSRYVWWKCEKEHEWETTINSRTSGTGCPYCSGRNATKDNNLFIKYPEIAKEWHPTKNKKSPYDYTPGSSLKVWWICKEGHEWDAIIQNRVKGSRCPECAKKRIRKIPIDKSLVIINPKLAREWHKTKNDVTPYEVTASSNKRFWWQCERGHEWQSTVLNRKNGSKCPYCTNKKVCPDNCLATTNSDLAKEWHPTKNKKTPFDVTFGSEERVWWLCKIGHEWKARVCQRSRGNGCPSCANIRRVQILNGPKKNK